MKTKATKKLSVRTITMVAMLAAVSFVLSFIQMPVPFSPPFARMDLADLPALIGAFAFGPFVGVLIELVKNLLSLFKTATGGVGELANFLINGSFVAVAGIVYAKSKTKKMAWIGCILGSVVRGIVAALANYFILLPMFEIFMPLDEVIAAFGAFMPFIQTKLDVVLYNALPLNMLQGLLISVVTMLIYKPLSGFLKRQ
ncbi:MAG: ECF transporter S component [Lachnospiraceae bacterium]|nr:ECF transporter S component [Candidatus Equihabitans merdae]